MRGIIAESIITEWIKNEGARTSLHHCTLDEVDIFVRMNPDVRIITDTKYWNKSLLVALSKLKVGGFIPQVYSLEEFYLARDLGFKDIIYSLYKQKSYLEISSVFDADELYAITIPASWYLAATQSDLKPHRGLSGYSGRIFVHSINAGMQFSEPKPSGVYTDWLMPGSLPANTCRKVDG